MTDRSPKLEARALEAAALRRKGRPLRYIAFLFRCSCERARQLCDRGLQLEWEQAKLATDPWYDLAEPVRNALRRDGCRPTIEAVLERYPSLQVLQRVPSMGVRRISQLQEWLSRHGVRPIR
jgi:hypothetical protein